MTTEGAWTVLFHDAFYAEYQQLPEDVQDALLTALIPLQVLGPRASRPDVDTLKGSSFPNMKELRFQAFKNTQVWRACFAFDTQQHAIVLNAAGKQGKSAKVFYSRLIKQADERYRPHLAQLRESSATAELAAEGKKPQAPKKTRRKATDK